MDAKRPECVIRSPVRRPDSDEFYTMDFPRKPCACMKISPSTEERTLFAQRLTSALKRADLSCSPAQVAHGFNLRARGASVTPHAVRKWVLGHAIPTQSNIQILSNWLGVNAAWLRFGEGQRHNSVSLISGDLPADPHMMSMLHDLRSLPNPAQVLVRGLIDVLLEAEASGQNDNI
ncbi:hypothetical protein [Massilia sp. CCM 8734]|uniref:hypothetical protein n=1 Tax=Massilia sp. CCM 8734 TaxID=2609283 RepID=UPI0014238C9B|nr:hypothetical protein [Massilia sp. CCM 8734]NIA00589.1 hypothetical protein [Massilia sp. CCM 8734]